MLNGLWSGMLVIALIFGGVSGRMDEVVAAGLTAAGEAAKLSLGLLGVLCFWCGVMEVLRQAGGIGLVGRVFRPVLKRLFPKLPENSPAMEAIVLNLSANMLGISNAATPLGLKAMKELQKQNRNPYEASNEMCTFLILNISSLQLIPVNMIAYRSQYGSANPTAIIAPAIFATLCSTFVAIIYCKLKDGRRG